MFYLKGNDLGIAPAAFAAFSEDMFIGLMPFGADPVFSLFDLNIYYEAFDETLDAVETDTFDTFETFAAAELDTFMMAFDFFDAYAPFAAFIATTMQLTEFTDVPAGHWAESRIYDMVRRGVIRGRSETIFAPADPITVREFLALSLRLSGAELPAAGGDYWHRYLSYARDNNLVPTALVPLISNADSATEVISRQDAFYILYRVFSHSLTTTWNRLTHAQPAADGELPFADMQEISTSHVDIITQLYRHRIVRGAFVDDNIYVNPSGSLLRAEVAMILFDMVTAYETISWDFTREISINVLDGFAALRQYPNYPATQGNFNSFGAMQFTFLPNQSGLYVVEVTIDGELSSYPSSMFTIRPITSGGAYRASTVLTNPEGQFMLLDGQRYVIEIFGESNQPFTVRVRRVGNLQLGRSYLELTRRPGGNFIYVNNPEWITEYDIIQPRTGENNNYLIFEQGGVVGYNNMYVTHSTIGQPAARQAFFYDISFFNSSNHPVSVEIAKPFTRLGQGWGWGDGNFVGMRYLDLERLMYRETRERRTITIPAGEQRLLFFEVMPIYFGGEQGLLVPQTARDFIGIYVDFTVQPGAEITVRTLAVYDPHFLNMFYDGTRLYAGIRGLVNTPIAGAPFVVWNMTNLDQSNVPRNSRSEETVRATYKGIDRGSTDTVEGHMNFIIDDSVIYRYLRVYQLDGFAYGHPFPRDRGVWYTHSNPFGVGIYPPSAHRLHARPYYMHRFDYFDALAGGTVVTRFDYLKVDTGVTPEYIRSRFAAPLVYGELTQAINQRFLDAQWLIMTGDDPIAPLPDNVRVDDFRYEVVSMASWGVTYEFTIDILNIGENIREIQYYIETSGHLAVTYRIYANDNLYISGAWAPRNWQEEMPGRPRPRVLIPIFGGSNPYPFNQPVQDGVLVEIQPWVQYRIYISVLFGAGTAGFTHRIRLHS